MAEKNAKSFTNPTDRTVFFSLLTNLKRANEKTYETTISYFFIVATYLGGNHEFDSEVKYDSEGGSLHMTYWYSNTNNIPSPEELEFALGKVYDDSHKKLTDAMLHAYNNCEAADKIFNTFFDILTMISMREKFIARIAYDPAAPRVAYRCYITCLTADDCTTKPKASRPKLTKKCIKATKKTFKKNISPESTISVDESTMMDIEEDKLFLESVSAFLANYNEKTLTDEFCIMVEEYDLHYYLATAIRMIMSTRDNESDKHMSAYNTSIVISDAIDLIIRWNERVRNNKYVPIDESPSMRPYEFAGKAFTPMCDNRYFAIALILKAYTNGDNDICQTYIEAAVQLLNELVIK